MHAPPADSHAADSASAGKTPKMQAMTTVAIVEDNRELRASLVAILEKSRGCRCLGAFASAEEALLEIPRCQPEVVIMDIHLPNRSGIECTRQLKELCPAIHVLILTVYEDNETIFNALKAGANGYLLKRASPEEILAGIGDVKEGGSPMSAPIARKVVASFHEDSRPGPPPGEQLTEREREVLDCLARGFSDKEIAEKMFVSINTIKTHLQHIYAKLHVRSRTQAVSRFRP